MPCTAYISFVSDSPDQTLKDKNHGEKREDLSVEFINGISTTLEVTFDEVLKDCPSIVTSAESILNRLEVYAKM